MSVMIKTDAGWKKVAGNAKPGGGGGGGTSDYTELSNKPKINNVELTGNKTLADIGAQAAITSSNKIAGDYVTYKSGQTVVAAIENLENQVGAANAALEEV